MDRAVSTPRRPAVAIATISASFFLVFLGVGATQQFLKSYLHDTHGLTAGQSAIVLATVYLAAFACQTFTTYSLRALTEYGALILGTGIYALFGVAMLLPWGFTALIAAAALWGFGSSIMWPAGAVFMLDASRHGRHGQASARLYTGVYVGQALGILLMAFLVGAVGQQGMMLGAVGITVLGAGLAATLPRPRVERAAPRMANPLVVLSSPTTRVAALVLVLSSSGYGLVLGLVAQVADSYHLSSVVGWSVASVGLLTVSFYVARIPAGPAAGWLIDHAGRGVIVPACFILSAVCLTLAVVVHQPITIAIAALALGVQAAAVPVATTSWVGDRARAEDRPYTWAAIGVWSNMGTGLSILVGQSLVGGLGGWQPAFLAFAACYLVCAGLATRLA